MAKIIMIQGTSSGVGKSIFSIALCRIFKEDGYKVAPFKSQNMSSNFHTLKNGDKMARSQAICAYACGLDPDIIMNPVLIIPEKENLKVILNGKSIGFMNNINYEEIQYKIFTEVMSSYNKLYNEYDIIVLEGSGSPVELNLSKNNIINMNFAKKIKSPVLIISDIIRGGIFASLYGTIKLMEKEEQNLVKGLVINKFKGNINSFNDGKKLIEDICAKNVLGVIPYFDVNIEDEDNLIDYGNVPKTKEYFMKGLKSEEEYLTYLNQQFDIISNKFRKSIDMNQIYKILETGI